MDLGKWLNKTSFKRQLTWTLVAGIVFVYVFSSIAVSYWTVHVVRNSMLEEGYQLAESLASQSVLALLYGSPENVREAATATITFPDVRSVSVFNQEGTNLLSLGEQPEHRRQYNKVPDATQLMGEDNNAFYFIAPVRFGASTHEVDVLLMDRGEATEEVIGYVELGVGKTRLNALARNVFVFNFVQSIVLAGLLLFGLLALTRRLTQPMQQLSETMTRAKYGETGLRSEYSGPKDVQDMQAAFNTMMRVIEERNQSLAEARDAALEVARIKGEFAANVSHELRTPLNGVLGMLELLRVSKRLSSTDRGYIDIAFNSGSSLLELINDILDFSKIETGQLSLHIEDFFLASLLGEVVSTIAVQAQRKHLNVVYLLAADVPTELRGDVARIRQVLINLVGNAVKFTDEGAVTIRVTPAGTVGRDPRLRFEVSDTGIGIPRQVHERIFEAFQQADGSTTRRYGGTGLGLAICRQLVMLMGGEIGVHSVEGEGSTFWFSMPLGLAITNIKPDRDHAAGLRILGIIPNDEYRIFLDTIVRSWGAYYRGVAEPARALLAIEEANTDGRPFDIIVLDEMLRNEALEPFLSALTQKPQYGRPGVVLLTAAGPGEAVQRPGVHSYLPKPVHETALYECLIATLQGKANTKLLPVAKHARNSPSIRGAILVVEDDRANQFVVKAMLERLDCTVDIARNGLEAIEKAERNRFDVILMDCQMPQMDGYEATRRIRESSHIDRHVPIIAMTAHSQERDEARCRAAGMDDYMTKPLRLKNLAALLSRWVNIPLDQQQETLASKFQHDCEGLDPRILAELRAQLGFHFEHYVDVYLEDTSTHLDTLSDSVEAKNLEAVAAISHALKGSSSTIGAVQVAELVANIEDRARRGEHEALPGLVKRLRHEFQQVVRFVNEHNMSLPAAHDDEPVVSGTILVVDDDRSVRMALRKVLENEGYLVIEANDGFEAIKYCERQCPDIILLDAMMPSLDGFEACARIRALPNSGLVPILMVTALDDQASIEQTISCGATDYIPKPVNFRLLRKRVARLLKDSRAEHDRWRLVYTDELTGLPNRMMFREQLAKMLLRPRSDDEGLAVLFLDLDRFKLANDTLGHDIGDLLIKAVAERISRCVRSSDLVARLGGDEFGVILDRIESREPVTRVAKSLCESLAVPFTFLEKDVFLGVSIGIAMYPDDGREIGALIKSADTAMFRSKEEKGGRFSFYNADMAIAVEARVDIERELRKAIERNQFILYYQPQVDVLTGRVVGVEALVRWEHPERGLIAPLEFITIAEDTGLILPIGEWVLLEACTRIEKIRRQLNRDIRVAVNICGKQLTHPAFVDQVRMALRNSGLPAQALELEITESSLISHHGEMQPRLLDVKALGVSLAVDDFGTGYSSLSYLTRLPVDIVKIDRVFVRGLPNDVGNANIVKAVIGMAAGLNMNVIAEGVESQEQLDALAAMGCGLMQGYFWNKPLPGNEFVNWLQQHSQPAKPSSKAAERPSALRNLRVKE